MFEHPEKQHLQSAYKWNALSNFQEANKYQHENVLVVHQSTLTMNGQRQI